MPLFNVLGCDSCSLKPQWEFLQTPRMPVILPKTADPCRIVVVGEAPGKNEDLQGAPFVGKSGRVLRDPMPGNWQDKVYWTNAVRCRPPENRTPKPQEVQSCSIYLDEDLARIKPHAVLGIGGIPLSKFLPSYPITLMRGIKFPIILKDGTPTWFMGTFHPSYVDRMNRRTDDGRALSNVVEPVFRTDIQKFFNSWQSFLTPPVIRKPDRTKILYPKTREEVLALYDRLKEPYGLDLETFKKKPYMRDALLLTCGMSDGETTFSWPVQWPGIASTWGYDVFVEVMNKTKSWIAANAAFELAWVWYHSKNPIQIFDDTQARGRLFHGRKGILGLDDLTRIHFGINVKELTGVKGSKVHERIMHGLPQALEYNAIDAWGADQLGDAIPVLADQIANHKRIIQSVHSTVCMELLGLDVDLGESERLKKYIQTEEDKVEASARALPVVQEYERLEGTRLSISAPQTIGHIIVNYCKAELPRSEKSNQYITDEPTLKKYRDTIPFVDSVLSWRELDKLRSTYIERILNGELLGIDGKLHGAYKTTSAITLRLASEDPNMQNFPKRKHKEIRKQIVAPPGHVMVTADYGRLEACLIAMASKDPNLCRELINNVDLHARWRDRVIKLYPKYLERLAQKTGETDDKKILKAGRDIIKTDFVFASFYGSLASSVAERAMLPLEVALQLLDEFWGPENYQGVKKWHQDRFEEYKLTGGITTLTGVPRNEVLDGNEPINTPSQGTAAILVLDAQNAVFYRGLAEDPYYLPRLNIHDDLGFILPDNDDRLEGYINVIADEMVKPRHDFCIVPLMAEFKIGLNWMEQEEFFVKTGPYFQ